MQETIASQMRLRRATEALAALGQVRTFGDTILRVRSPGYTGGELGVAGTSLVSHKPSFEHSLGSMDFVVYGR